MTDQTIYSAVNDRDQAVTIVRRDEQDAFTFHLFVDGQRQYQEAFALAEAQTLFFNHVIASARPPLTLPLHRRAQTDAI